MLLSYIYIPPFIHLILFHPFNPIPFNSS